MINKNGNIKKENIYESDAMNILVNSEKYTKENPYVLSGISNDIYTITNQYCHITPGKIYYYMTKQTNKRSYGNLNYRKAVV